MDHIILYTMLFQRLPTSVVVNGGKSENMIVREKIGQRENRIQMGHNSSGL